MNAVTTVVRIARKSRRMAIAWGLVAAATPMVASGQTGNGAPAGGSAGPFGSSYRSGQTIEDSAPAGGGNITPAQFDFVNEGPVRRYATPTTSNAWQGEDEGAGGFGLGARVGHDTGNTVGREQSITKFELMPYVISGDQMVLGSFRFFRGDQSEFGGSTTLGYRRYIENWNKIFGFNSSYYLDDHRGTPFEQAAMGLELLGDTWDLRANWYVPTGTKTRVLGTSIVSGSERFAGNNLVFTSQTDIASAAEGFDLMLTVPVPGDWMAEHDVEASAGVYHFQSRDTTAEGLWGYRLRADAGFLEDLAHLFLELNSDDQTDVGVTFGVSLDWHGGINTVRRRGGSQRNRMGEFLRQNDHIVTIDQPVITAGVTAINPTTGLPYTIAHVDQLRDETAVFDPTSAAYPLGGAPAGGVGTFENPFVLPTDIPVALAGGSDIVFVAGGAGNSYTTPVTIGANQALLGEGTGVVHRIDVEGFTDQVVVPSPSVDRFPGLLVRPTLTDPAGIAVTLNDASRFGGFVIQGAGATTTGITSSATSGTLNDITMLNINGDGMVLNGASGTFTFENFQVGELAGAVPQNGASGTAFLVDGGTASVNFIGLTAPASASGSLIANTAGLSVLVQNTVAGNVGLSTLNVVDTGGDGILIQDFAGGVTLGDGTLTNTTGSGVRILNGAGTVSMLGGISIINPGNDAFVINNLLAPGQVNAGLTSSLTVNQPSANNVGLQLNRIAGNVTFNGSTAITSNSGLGALDPAVNFQNSTGAATVNNLTITNWTGPGVNVGDLNPAAEGAFDPVNAIDNADPDETNGPLSIFTIGGISTFTNVGFFSGLTNENANFQIFNDFGTVQTQGTLSINERNLGHGIVVQGMQPESRVSFGSVSIDDDNNTLFDEAILVTQNQGPVSFGLAEIIDSGTAAGNLANVVTVTNNNRALITDPLEDAAVTFGELSITGATLLPGLSALLAQNNDRFNVDGGVIEVEAGRAITAINNLNTLDAGGVPATIIDFLEFDSITVTDGGLVDAGVFLRNNRGDFVINGIPDSPGSGGTIDSVGIGIDIEDLDGQVEINGLEVQSTAGNAIRVVNTQANNPFVPVAPVLAEQADLDTFRNLKTSVSLDAVTLENTGIVVAQSVLLTNVDEFVLADSTIDSSATIAIDYNVTQSNDQDLSYVVDIRDTNITTIGFGTVGIIDVNIGGTDDEDSNLAFLVQNTNISSNTFDVGGINVVSDGSVNASILGGAASVIDVGDGFAGFGISAIEFNVGDDTNSSAIEIRDYTITQASSDIGDGAISITADGDLGLEIDNNIINVGNSINQLGDFAIELDVNDPGADIEIVGNIFNMFELGQTVVDVSGLVGPSSFFFDDNTINFTPHGFGNQEFVLQFTGLTGVISIDGDNNAVPTLNFGTTFFQGNAANFIGNVEIGGVSLP